ncbi:hypothetical protein EI94DRAFT_192942 [Lactarius quietus]|nr:hypothetical protein EI94DRAFT_192942 [Lactarius quietus]
MSPSPSSAGAMIAARAAVSSPSPNDSMTPTVVILVSISVFAVSGISFFVWRRLFSMFRSLYVNSLIPAQERRRIDDCDLESGQPEMFDAWTELCTPNILKWEEYMPFSVTVLTNAETKRASEPVQTVGKLQCDRAREKRERESKGQGSCQRLQVGVLVAMPSQRHRRTYDGAGQEPQRSPLLGGLAIGIVEIPWIEDSEDRRLLEKIAS